MQLRNVGWQSVIEQWSDNRNHPISTILSNLVGPNQKVTPPDALRINDFFISQQHKCVGFSVIKKEKCALGPKHFYVLIISTDVLHQTDVILSFQKILVISRHKNWIDLHMQEINQILVLLSW